ncbi:hypothetical protein GCM10011297_09070 [Bacterioplanes sanyensis]|nr:hypothetical protein GCM10011297_09070 [Bacterioplanes sanyensis]
MQMAASVGTQANDVARIGRDFGFKQHNIEHSLGSLGGTLVSEFREVTQKNTLSCLVLTCVADTIVMFWI